MIPMLYFSNYKYQRFFPYYEMKNKKKLLSIYNSRFTCSKYMANIKHESSL